MLKVWSDNCCLPSDAEPLQNRIHLVGGRLRRHATQALAHTAYDLCSYNSRIPADIQAFQSLFSQGRRRAGLGSIGQYRRHHHVPCQGDVSGSCAEEQPSQRHLKYLHKCYTERILRKQAGGCDHSYLWAANFKPGIYLIAVSCDLYGSSRQPMRSKSSERGSPGWSIGGFDRCWHSLSQERHYTPELEMPACKTYFRVQYYAYTMICTLQHLTARAPDVPL